MLMDSHPCCRHMAGPCTHSRSPGLSSPRNPRGTPTRRAAANAQRRLLHYYNWQKQGQQHGNRECSPHSPDVAVVDLVDDEEGRLAKVEGGTHPCPTPYEDVAMRKGQCARAVARRAKKGEPLASGWAIAGFSVDRKEALIDGVQEVDAVYARCVFCDTRLVVKKSGRSQISWTTCSRHLISKHGIDSEAVLQRELARFRSLDT